MSGHKTLSADLNPRARKMLRKNEVSAPEPPSAEQMQRLLQELRVQQKELEMQNEELRRAQYELESRAKRVEESLGQAHDELEARVAERTAAHALANQQLKKIHFELVWAEERERERIACELREQVGQSLLLAKMKLDALADKIPSALLRASAEVTALVEKSINDIRALTFRMRPPLLDSAGIELALEWLCSSVSSDYSLQIDFVNDCQPKPLPSEIRYSLYHAVRELLLNVVKHAKTDKANLSVKTDNHTLVVHVADYGIGFEHHDARLNHVNSGSYGLYKVRHRVEQMGGRFAIESTPGWGTAVTLMVPLSKSDN